MFSANRLQLLIPSFQFLNLLLFGCDISVKGFQLHRQRLALLLNLRLFGDCARALGSGSGNILRCFSIGSGDLLLSFSVSSGEIFLCFSLRRLGSGEFFSRIFQLLGINSVVYQLKLLAPFLPFVGLVVVSKGRNLLLLQLPLQVSLVLLEWRYLFCQLGKLGFEFRHVTVAFVLFTPQ